MYWAAVRSLIPLGVLSGNATRIAPKVHIELQKYQWQT